MSFDTSSARVFDDDVAFAMRHVSDPQISPDGSKIAYSLRWLDRGGEGVRKNAIWIMDGDGQNPRYLTAGGAPRWSPDGQRLLYSSADGQGRSQLFVRTLDGSKVIQLTDGDQSPMNPVWSPDGKSVAFGRLVPESAGPLYQWPEGVKPRGEERIIKRLHHKYDGIGYLDHGYTHAFVVSAEGGEAKQLTKGLGELESKWRSVDISWSPNAQHLLVTGNFGEDAELFYDKSYIYRVNVRTGRMRQLFDDPSGTDNWHNAVYSPDGKKIAYVGKVWSDQFTYFMSHLWVADANGENRRRLTSDLGEGVYDFKWKADSTEIYFTDGREGAYNLYSSSLTGDITPLTTGMHFRTLNSLSDEGDAVGTYSAYKIPDDIVRFSLEDAQSFQQLTNVNQEILQDVDFGGLEDIWYTTKDGARIQAWIYTPPGFDASRKYPLIVSGHGGPQSMASGADFKTYNFRYAAEGYVVLYPNYRNSQGYGEAFMNQEDPWFPNDRTTDDIVSGVEALVEKGYVDPDRLFITGYSAGGVLASWMVGQTDIFKAAVAQAPETNRISDTLTSDAVQWFATKYPTPFWEDPTSWLKSSPIMYTGNVTTPTMFIVGMDDLRTPPGQSNEFFTALKLAGKAPTELIYVPDAYHGTEISANPHAHARWRFHVLNWFKKWDPAHQ